MPSDDLRPRPALLAEVEDIRLIHWPGEGPATLVVFTPGREAAATPTRWWGNSVAAALGWNTLAFSSAAQNWYPRGAMARLLPQALGAIGEGGSVAYGFSMGGYAALKYGKALRARASLALSPQYSIDPHDMPGDQRAQHFFDSALHAGMRVTAEDVSPLAFFAYDPLEPQDAAHGRRLAEVPGLRPVHLRRIGHATPAVLAEARSAKTILSALAAGDAAAALAGIRVARRASPTLITTLALTAEARGHAGWAQRLRAALPQAPRAERSLAAQARVMHQLGRYREELPLLRAWIREQPRSLDAHLQHASCCLAIGDTGAAVEAIRGAMALGRVDQRMHAALVNCLRRQNRVAEAVDAARAAAAANPRLAAPHVQLGDTLLWAQRRPAAREVFARALAIDPRHAGARRGAAVAEGPAPGGGVGPLLSGLIGEMAKSRAPAADWIGLADQLAMAKRMAAPMRVLRRAVAVHPEEVGLRLRLGHALVRAGRADEAMAVFAEAAQARPESVEGWLGASDAMWRLRRLEEGRVLLAAAVAAHPDHPVLAARHASFLLAGGELEAAEREARRAVALSPPGDETAVLGLADVLWRQQRAQDALKLVEAACEAQPASRALAARLGHLYLSHEMPGRAVAAFERVVAKGRSQVHTWLGLTEALWQTTRAQAAVDAARRGLGQHPDSAELKARLGQLLLVTGDTEAARMALAEAMSAAPESAEIQLALADALWRQGRRAEALQTTEAAAAALPDKPDVQARLGHLLVEVGRIDEAAAIFERLTREVPQLGTAWAGLCEVERQRKRLKQAVEACRRAEQEGVDRQTLRMLRFRLFGEIEG